MMRKMLIIGQNLGPHFVRACAVDMHVHMSQEASKELLYTKKYRKSTPGQIEARTRTKTLYEPAQSKCISTCHKRQQKSYFIRPDWVQNADEHFVRACAVEMQVHLSQATSEEPLYTEIVRKNAAAQNVLRTQPHILCEPAQSKRMSKFHKSHFILKFTGKMPGPKLSTLIKHRP